jgi:hypothetical protein
MSESEFGRRIDVGGVKHSCKEQIIGGPIKLYVGLMVHFNNHFNCHCWPVWLLDWDEQTLTAKLMATTTTLCNVPFRRPSPDDPTGKSWHFIGDFIGE